MASRIHGKLIKSETENATGHFPVYHVPDHACFVIKRDTLEQFIQRFFPQPFTQKSASRMSTPVSRLLWLACKHNDAIGPLVDHPYKLASIFEQWATGCGITDDICAETLKTAFKRGSPQQASKAENQNF
ncbi:hypothetical protein [Superficieibacter electus]|uniref:hypothetical protein n=1 Tax=Superficieibacter electus TaxID=2022662 RepID=UPI001057118E|nr:hypothetical protein [Superficieibacter electus]